ncbi:hypothetical protein CS053_05780 [Rhodanobacter glycinis]|uniref:Uncharacterized protein n=1 Tax=Rhodanobacter glycinis TaxID=582702 RepID=A0A5B9E7W7_9GAMM|nr:hypothetical protein CS053_05780 [Rhodanobacter glycinis]
MPDIRYKRIKHGTDVRTTSVCWDLFLHEAIATTPTIRSSRQQPLKAGDVFVVPLRARGYGFGRLLYLDGRWRLAEFFACFRKTPEFSNDILEAHRAMPVHNIVTLPIESGDWPVVARNTDVSSIDLESLKFYRGSREHAVAWN